MIDIIIGAAAVATAGAVARAHGAITKRRDDRRLARSSKGSIPADEATAIQTLLWGVVVDDV